MDARFGQEQRQLCAFPATSILGSYHAFIGIASTDRFFGDRLAHPEMGYRFIERIS